MALAFRNIYIVHTASINYMQLYLYKYNSILHSSLQPHPVAVAEQSPASVEANKFDTLCNGALNALALVHSAIQQVSVTV